MNVLLGIGVDISEIVFAGRYSEYTSYENHIVLGQTLEIDFLERVVWGNPSNTAFMLFLGIIILRESLIFSKKQTNLMIVLFLFCIVLAVSRTFIVLSVGYILLEYIKRHKINLSFIVKLTTIFTLLSLVITFSITEYSDELRVHNVFDIGGLRFQMHHLFISEYDKFMFVGPGSGYFSNTVENYFGYRTTEESLYLSFMSKFGIGFSIILILMMLSASKPLFSKRLLVLFLLAGVVIPITDYVFFMIFIGVIRSINRYKKNSFLKEKKYERITQ